MGLFSSKNKNGDETTTGTSDTKSETNRANVWRTVAIVAIVFGLILLLVVGYFLFLYKPDCPVCQECVISVDDIPKVENASKTLTNYKATVKSLTSVDTSGEPISVVSGGGSCAYDGGLNRYQQTDANTGERRDFGRAQDIVLGKGVEPGVIVLPSNKGTTKGGSTNKGGSSNGSKNGGVKPVAQQQNLRQIPQRRVPLRPNFLPSSIESTNKNKLSPITTNPAGTPQVIETPASTPTTESA